MSNRYRANRSFGGKIDRLETKVAKTEKLVSPVPEGDQNKVRTEDIAQGAVGTDQLGLVSEIKSDYNITLSVGPTGHISLSGEAYTTLTRALLGINGAGDVVAVPMPIVYGVVDPAYVRGQAKIKFEGETELSGPYSYTNAYVPSANDKVALSYDANGSYLIIGKVLPV